MEAKSICDLKSWGDHGAEVPGSGLWSRPSLPATHPALPARLSAARQTLVTPSGKWAGWAQDPEHLGKTGQGSVSAQPLSDLEVGWWSAR